MVRCPHARFTASNVRISAKLSTGEVIDCYTMLVGYGGYASWWEYPTGYPEHGSENFVDYDIDDNSIEVLYPDEWDFVDANKQNYMYENPDAFEGVKIVEIVEIKDTPDWDVDEDSLNDE